jgi:hypothetical protein
MSKCFMGAPRCLLCAVVTIRAAEYSTTRIGEIPGSILVPNLEQAEATAR